MSVSLNVKLQNKHCTHRSHDVETYDCTAPPKPAPTRPRRMTIQYKFGLWDVRTPKYPIQHAAIVTIYRINQKTESNSMVDYMDNGITDLVDCKVETFNTVL